MSSVRTRTMGRYDTLRSCYSVVCSGRYAVIYQISNSGVETVPEIAQGGKRPARPGHVLPFFVRALGITPIGNACPFRRVTARPD